MQRIRYGYIVLVALIPLAALYAIPVARPKGVIEIMAGVLFMSALATYFGLRLAERVLLTEDSVQVRTPFADYRFPWTAVIRVSTEGPKAFLHVRGSVLPFAITKRDHEALSRRLSGTGR